MYNVMRYETFKLKLSTFKIPIPLEIILRLSTSVINSTQCGAAGSSTTSEDLGNVCRLLDADLRPLTPDDTCKRSREIFEEHKQIAQEYLKVQTEIALLSQHKNEMLKNLSIDSLRQQQELRKLEDEKVSLFLFYILFTH